MSNNPTNKEDKNINSKESDIQLKPFQLLSESFDIPSKEIHFLEAYYYYFFQIIDIYSKKDVQNIIDKYPSYFKMLYNFFYTKFNTELENSQNRKNVLQTRIQVIKEIIYNNKNKKDKNILLIFYNLIKNTVRTNFFSSKSPNDDYCISLKFKSNDIKYIKDPKPFMEIFIYAKKFIGIHIRLGKFSRGGIRWSNREDIRTEIFSLVKAQDLKNTMIIPRGGKGGFLIRPDYVKYINDPEFVESQYKKYVSSLLELTTNIVHGEMIEPENVICYDPPDPYIAIAPDKGTGTFSDLANDIAIKKNFWLNDSFASSSSTGYSHKKIGITSRGAWESGKIHLNYINKNLNNNLISIIGIGDMSGDVFGNGLIYSDNLLLKAAFNHIHIFIDPNPNPKISYNERVRLFNLKTSSWKDYNPNLISSGGGVFNRQDQDISLSQEIKQWLKIDKNNITGDELIKYILKSNVDLVWNGGIGTYIKSSSEKNKDASDKLNDLVRVNGKDLNTKIFVEGGNLGITQLGRIEYAKKGGLLFCDSLDNSAGVHLSDYEVNLKIFLNLLMKKNILSKEQRSIIISDSRDKIVAKVIKNNSTTSLLIYINTLKLRYSILKKDPSIYKLYLNLINDLVEKGILNLSTVNLRDISEYESEFSQLINKNFSSIKEVPDILQKPELFVILSYEKLRMKLKILESNIPLLPISNKFLYRYFSFLFDHPIFKSKEDFIKEMLHHHYLKKEIISSQITNHIFLQNNLLIFDLKLLTNYPYEELVRSFLFSEKLLFSQHILNFDKFYRKGTTAVKNLDLEPILTMENIFKNDMLKFLL